MLVFHDELDLPLGTVRVKSGGGHGGHNGLRDLHKHFGREYQRVRVGVGRPPNGWDAADYVLSKWSDQDLNTLPEVQDKAADAVEAVVRDGLDRAMNLFNVRVQTTDSLPKQITIDAQPRTEQEPE